MSGHGEQATQVLEFWFVHSRPRQWFAKDPPFDALLPERFLGLTRRQFWLMPLMHAEELAVQEAALSLFERFSDSRTADLSRRHRDVIAWRLQMSWPFCRHQAHGSEPSGPTLVGR